MSRSLNRGRKSTPVQIVFLARIAVTSVVGSAAQRVAVRKKGRGRIAGRGSSLRLTHVVRVRSVKRRLDPLSATIVLMPQPGQKDVRF